MTIEAFSNWLNSYHKFGVKLDLSRIKHICKELNHPQKSYKIVHVGGTNGKGSACRYLYSILKESGYKTGIYTSPHLERFSERIIVNNKEISEIELNKIFNKIRPIVDEMIKKEMTPTYFEIVTAIAFLYFKIKNVDIAVIEVGLGGRFDATNIVKPVLSVICNVSMEHQDRLGDTLEKISFEKAGIIKKNIPVVTSAKNKALKVIKNVSKEKNSKVYEINESNWKRTYKNSKSQIFTINFLDITIDVKTKILGYIQGENIALAIASIFVLQNYGFKIDNKSIEKGVFNTKNPGRMEIVSTKPVILLDGAHNPEGIKKLKESLENDFKFNRLILIIGILEDKKYIDMLETIVPICDIVVTTKSKNKRSLSPYTLKREVEFVDYKKTVIPFETIDKAVLYAKGEAGIKDMVCICGSLFTVGEARSFLKEIILF